MKLADLPVHDIPGLSGPNAPIDKEVALTDLEVIGEMPKDLNGIHVRNGPNPWFPPGWRYHVYDGDGMLHPASSNNGRVSSRTRWTRTRSLKEEIAAGKPLWGGLKKPPRKDRPDEPQKN